MSVFVLFHADIEDDRYVRGVYADRAIAEADIEAVEATDFGYDKDHHEWCCSVDEMPLLAHAIGLTPMLGPEKPVDRSGGYLVPPAFLTSLVGDRRTIFR